MIPIKFQLIPSPQFNAQLIKGVSKNGSEQFAYRTIALAPTILSEIGNMLVRKFNATQVAKSLRGHGSTDLPAHFGLNDTTANLLADGMANLIRQSVRLQPISSDGTITIRIQAVQRDWEQYLGLPGAEYVSYPSEIMIPVVRWLLIDPTIDIGQAAYDIVFAGQFPQFEATIQKFSRSGRAIMVSLQSLGGTGGYVLPSIVAGKFGENFIEYTIGQYNVAQEAAQILIKKVG